MARARQKLTIHALTSALVASTIRSTAASFAYNNVEQSTHLVPTVLKPHPDCTHNKHRLRRIRMLSATHRTNSRPLTPALRVDTDDLVGLRTAPTSSAVCAAAACQATADPGNNALQAIPQTEADMPRRPPHAIVDQQPGPLKPPKSQHFSCSWPTAHGMRLPASGHCYALRLTCAHRCLRSQTPSDRFRSRPSSLDALDANTARRGHRRGVHMVPIPGDASHHSSQQIDYKVRRFSGSAQLLAQILIVGSPLGQDRLM